MPKMLLAALLLASTPQIALAAEPAPAASAASVDPARLKAAQALVEQINPPSQRAATTRAMIGPMFANIRQALMADPNFTKLTDGDPRVKPVLDRFLERIGAEAAASVSASLPKLYDAMAVAYARQFTVAQLDEVRAFYASPTGHEFTSKAPQILADPAVMQAQRDMMSAEMAHLPAIMADLKREVAALNAGKAPPK